MASYQPGTLKELSPGSSPPCGIGGVFKDSKRPSSIQKAAFRCYKEGLYSDVTVVVQEWRFKTHRMVLASLSDFFPPLLKLDQTETGEVTIHEVNAEDFALLLEFAYTGEIEVKKENVQSILMAADYLTIPFVGESCEMFMSNNLDCDNICDVIRFSSNYSLSLLQDKARDFLCKNLHIISKSPTYLQFDPEFLVSFFDDDNLILYRGDVVKSTERERMILKAILRFLSQVPPPTKDVFQKLLHTVRLPILSKDVIQKCVKKFRSVEKSDTWKLYFEKVDSASRYIKDALQGNQFAESEGVDAGIPASWFRNRILASFYIKEGQRYAAGGQIARAGGKPKPDHDDPNLELFKIELWIRRWDDRPVVGGMRLKYRKMRMDGQIVESVRGEMNKSWEKYTVKLHPHEHIVSATVGCGWLIDRLAFETSHGRNFDIGGPGGSKHIENAESGKTMYLHDINCDTVQTQGHSAIYNLLLRWIVLE